MKTKLIYVLFIALIFSLFYPLTKQIVFKNYIIDAAQKYVINNKDKMPGIDQNDFKAKIPIIILKKENYIKYLVESPRNDIDINSYYIEIENNKGNLEYTLRIKEEG